MKGLLHRLATRAAGTAPLVRSSARLPFSGGGLTWADEVLNADSGSVHDTLPATSVSWPDEAIQQAEQASSRAKVVKSTAAAIEIHAGAPALPSQVYRGPAVMLPDAVRPTAEPPAVPLVPVSERHDGAQSQSGSERREGTKPSGRGEAVGLPEPNLREVAPLRVPGRPAPALSVESDQPESMPAAAPRFGTSSRGTTLSPLAAPALLMPPAFVRVNTSMALVAPQAMAPLGPERHAHDDTTEVHIHIGRIDVTAVHEAPAPRPRPKQRPAPRSLDSYLAARSKT